MRRLFWKEFQQLTPLLGVLLAMGLGLHLVLLFIPGWAELPGRFSVVVYGLPTLFAVGAGALLVGQEKELRTLYWLQSLPIAPRDIVRVKLYAALLGLACTWSGSLLVGALVAAIDPRTTWYQMSLGHQRWMIPAHALALFFLVFSGIAISWRMRSATVSLLTLVPIILVPFLVANLTAWLVEFSGQWVSPASLNWLQGGCLALATLLAWRVSWKSGQTALSARSLGVQWWSRDPYLARPMQAAVRSAPASPTTALVWQFARQHGKLLIGMTCILMVSGITLVFSDSVPKGFVATAIFGAVLTWSWLGLLVFQGDTAEDRCLFLATRGVSPWQIWLTRQLIPCSIVTGSLVLLYFGLWQADLPVGINVSAAGVLAVLVFFLASQWFGQCVRSVIVGAILSPLVGFGAVAWLTVASAQLPAPPWSLFTAGTIPLVATRLMTRHWMDQRRGRVHWVSHGGLLCLFLVIPAIPLLFFVVSYPRVPGRLARELESLVGQTTLTDTVTEVLTRDRSDTKTPDTSRGDRLAAIETRLRNNRHAVPDSWSLKFVVADLEVTRLQSLDDSSAKAIPPYRDALRLLLIMRDRLRNSHRLLDQDLADGVDIWLLRESQSTDAVSYMGRQLRIALIRKVADREHRHRMRQRAVAFSWRTAGTANLGGYLLPADPMSATTLQSRFTQRRNSHLLSALLAEKLTAARAEYPRIDNRIRNLMSAVPGTRPARQTMPASSALASTEYLNELFRPSVPSLRWQGTWEDTADELASSLPAAESPSRP